MGELVMEGDLPPLPVQTIAPLGSLLVSASGELALVGSSPLPKNRFDCPYYQASGCILDQLEKACESDGRPKMSPEAKESVWMCCCPEPYIACGAEEADAFCMETLKGLSQDKMSIDSEFDQNDLMLLRSQLLATSPDCFDFVHSRAKKARCGQWASNMPTLMCEMLTWQWEELGDGDQGEFDQYRCPLVLKNGAMDGDHRKSQRLSWDPWRVQMHSTKKAVRTEDEDYVEDDEQNDADEDAEVQDNADRNKQKKAEGTSKDHKCSPAGRGGKGRSDDKIGKGRTSVDGKGDASSNGQSEKYHYSNYKYYGAYDYYHAQVEAIVVPPAKALLSELPGTTTTAPFWQKYLGRD